MKLNTDAGRQRYDRNMSDPGPPGYPQSVPGLPGYPSPGAGPPSWPAAPAVAFRRPPRWPTVAAWGIAFLALVVGAVGWYRPAPHTDRPPASAVPAFTEQQIADAKANICAAYKLSKDEVAENSHNLSPGEGDEARAIAVATNGRLAIYTAGDYLLNRLTAEPATPDDLEHLVRSVANSYIEAAMRAINNAPDSVLAPYERDIEAHSSKIDGLCK